MSDSDFRLVPEGPQSLIIRRSFDADAEDIMAAHLDPEILVKWMGAPEFPLSVCEVEARTGGRYRFAWTRPDGSQSWMAGTFLDVGPTRLVATEAHRPDWTGGQMRVTLEVKDHEDRGWMRRVIDFGTPAARNQAMGTMAPGAKASLDRLAAVLEEE